VVLLRDSDNGIETLLLKRNKALLFAGGLWVFPGGAIDPEDIDAANGDLDEASRLAAVREALEESGLQPHLDDMILMSHWTTPVVEPKRFYTWIYAAPVASDDDVIIDGSEIHESRWLTLRQAILEHDAGDLGMLPPTYITMRELAPYETVAQLLSAEQGREPYKITPVFGDSTDPLIVMFRGDAGYDSGDDKAQGPQHRAVFRGESWEYIYRDVDSALAPLIKP
jgi:8-oxo-dGTP pyrophosphatase MutT (NUDIX family)